MGSADVRPFAATGIGSLPGVASAEAARVVAGELPDLPHVPELPARGPGADVIGRTAGMLAAVAADLATETTPGGWRFAQAPGREMRRAASWLGEDLDAVEECLQGYRGPLKTQVAGPWTLAAVIELASGERAVRDPGACRDIAGALAEAVARHVGELRRRVPGAQVVVQLDEPMLGAVLRGGISTASGLAHYRPVDEQAAIGGLETVAAGATQGSADAGVLVHDCERTPPLDIIRRSRVAGLAIDLAVHDQRDDDLIGEALDSGMTVVLGVVPSLPVAVRSPVALGEAAARLAQGLLDRLGFAASDVGGRIALSPACGLAGASPGWVRTAYAALAEAGRLLRDESGEPGEEVAE